MFKFYEVGGKIRDEFLGKKSKDIDYVAVPNMDRIPEHTDMEQIFALLVEYLNRKGFTIFLTTPRMYTIRAQFPRGYKKENLTADFVIARKEIGYKEGTREPILVPGTLLDDLTRRDFTINAIAKDEEGNIYDPFDGRNDIELGILRTPISGEITFTDDPLRLLRAIRFAITKDFVISQEISDMIVHFNYDEMFKVVSEERIREELYKCFKHNTLDTLKMLEYYDGLKNYIFTRTKLWLKPTNEE
jgi:tRNA nucleotidyltransferase/poly(A) polymerase